MVWGIIKKQKYAQKLRKNVIEDRLYNNFLYRMKTEVCTYVGVVGKGFVGQYSNDSNVLLQLSTTALPFKLAFMLGQFGHLLCSCTDKFLS